VTVNPVGLVFCLFGCFLCLFFDSGREAFIFGREGSSMGQTALTLVTEVNWNYNHWGKVDTPPHRA